MKRSSKIMLVIAGIFAAAGIGFTAAGLAMGARLDPAEVIQEAEKKYGDHFIHFYVTPDEDWDEDMKDGTFLKESDKVGERIYELSELKDLDMEFSNDELIFQKHDGTGIRVEVTGDPKQNIRVAETGSTLKIKSIKKAETGRKVTIFYPGGYEFRDVKIDMAAGKMTMEQDFKAELMDINMGTGEFRNFGRMEAKEAELQVGAGTIELENLRVTDLDGECGIGNLHLEIEGKEEDYNYDLECGVGHLSVGSQDYSGFAKEKKITNPGAKGKLNLQCGIGELFVTFTKM